jgi:quercetin dioxygenase-like cupin family protein
VKVGNLEDMLKGWFVGNFDPSVLKTDACEVGIKPYKKGDTEEEHYHKVATEITVILNGRVRMCGEEYVGGDIVVIKPGVATAFEALEDSATVVVKVPGATNDKYLTHT